MDSIDSIVFVSHSYSIKSRSQKKNIENERSSTRTQGILHTNTYAFWLARASQTIERYNSNTNTVGQTAIQQQQQCLYVAIETDVETMCMNLSIRFSACTNSRHYGVHSSNFVDSFESKKNTFLFREGNSSGPLRAL